RRGEVCGVAGFVSGLAVSGFFRRSRLFFALLALGIAQVTFAWVIPHLSPRAGKITADAVALLWPFNLLVLAFVRERGIISPTGRKRLAIVGAQILAVWVLCMPAFGDLAKWTGRAFAPLGLSAWSGLSQPALLAFVMAAIVITF